MQKASKFACQPGAKHHKIAISVVDVLQRRLHAEPLFKTASPCEFERIFRTLIESSVLPRQSVLVATVGISHPQLGIAVTAVVAVGVLGILRHAGDFLVGGLPHLLLAIHPPGATRLFGGLVGLALVAVGVNAIVPCVYCRASKIVAARIRKFKLRHIENAIFLRTHQKWIIVLAPTVVAHAIVEAVSEREATFAHIEIHGQARKRIVGNGITRRNRGKDATRAVEKQCCDIGSEKILIHISHAQKQMRPLPLVHITQHSNRRSGVFLLNVGKALSVIDDGLVGAQHMERGSLNRA